MYKFAVAIALLLLMPTGPALCAEPGKSSEAGPEIVEKPALPYLTLLLARDPAVHSELKLNAQQGAKLNQAIALVDNSFWVLRDVPVAQCGDKLDELLQQLRGELAKILSPQQASRFDEIVLQARGFKALVSSELADQLKLTDDQQARIRQLIAAAETPGKPVVVAATEKPGAKAKTPTKSTAKSTAKSSVPDSRQILAVLTSAQSTQLSKLTGEPIDLGRVRQIGCVAPELRGVSAWINTEGLNLDSQRGQVVALHFWAFGCINCVRNLPHYQSWYEKFSKSDLTILGVHTPETESERSVDNLRANIKERSIQYPVAFDAASENWKAWGNHMWPSVYLIDKQGRVRYWWYGELNWEGAKGEEFMRQKIAELIAEE